MPHVTDEELEYYGELYIRCEIREAGVDFENFLSRPEYYLYRYARTPWRPRSNGKHSRWGGFRRLIKFCHFAHKSAE
jgi:hypothetical protein